MTSELGQAVGPTPADALGASAAADDGEFFSCAPIVDPSTIVGAIFQLRLFREERT